MSTTKKDIDTILDFIKALKTTSSGTTTPGINTVKMYETGIKKKSDNPNDTTYDTLWKAHNEYNTKRKGNEEQISDSLENFKYLLGKKKFTDEFEGKKLLHEVFTITERYTPYGKIKKINVDDKIFKNPKDVEVKKLIKESIDIDEVKKFKGKEIKKKTTEDEIVDAMLESLKLLPQVSDKLNEDLYKELTKISKKTHESTSGSSPDFSKLPKMEGGASDLVGEYEAYKNTMNLEKESVKMIGGAEVWHPGLDEAATQRSKMFAQAFQAIKRELKNRNKELSSKDVTEINKAINSLAKRESNIYGELKTLRKYAQLLEKYKDNKSNGTGQEVFKSENVSATVSKYFKDVSRADKKAGKINKVLGTIIVSLF